MVFMDGDAENPQEPGKPRGEFAPDVTGRPIWRLLLRGLGVYLPGWEMPAGALRVRDGRRRRRGSARPPT